MDHAKRVAIYVRVSTGDQNPDMQKTELIDYCNWRKWQIIQVYSDTMSGTKDKRPNLDRLMADARRGRFDVVACWKFDRFARNVRFLLNTLEEFKILGIDFVSARDAIDTTSPAGKLVFAILGAVAELEAATIRERVIAGQNAAKRRGVRFGRPVVSVDVNQLRKLRSQGLSWRAIAAEMKIPKDTLIRRASV